MLARSAARSVCSALARQAASVAPKVQLVTESVREAQAAAPGRAQVLRAPRGIDDADFARALKALAAQHQPLIELPDALQQGIADWVTGGAGQSGRQLRHNSRRLLDHLRAQSRSSTAGGSAFAPQELEDESLTQLLHDVRFKQEPAPRAVAAPSYSSREVAAYAASRLPCTYAALRRVFDELSARVPGFCPESVLDFGSGPGTAVLAAAFTWPAALRESVCVELSRDMLELADVLRESVNASHRAEQPEAAEGDAAAPRAPDFVPPSRAVPYLSRLNGRPQRRRYDLVVAAFSLGELPNEVARQQTVQRLWSHASDILVIVEPGTPMGSSIVRAARSTVLQFEARKVRTAAKRAAAAGEAGTAEGAASAAGAGGAPGGGAADEQPEVIGAHVVAPCAHDKRCPMDGADWWCHFSQRLQRPDTQRAVKGGASARTYQDERFSYVVLRRGVRPSRGTSLDAAPAAFAPVDEVADLAPDDDSASSSEGEGELDGNDGGVTEPLPSAEARAAAVAAATTGWSRVVRPPNKRSGHVVLELCTPSGSVQQQTVAASHNELLGPGSYRMARKARWGDAWPHPAVVRRTRIDEEGQWCTALEAADDSDGVKPRSSSLGEQHLE